MNEEIENLLVVLEDMEDLGVRVKMLFDEGRISETEFKNYIKKILEAGKASCLNLEFSSPVRVLVESLFPAM